VVAAKPSIAHLVGSARRVAFVGLAKNTGKTQTLTSVLGELERAGVRVGVTSIGRDGERKDAIDPRIEKPPVRLARDSLVASTEALLRASGVAYERLARTRVRTPLGVVVVARLAEAGAVEVAGPSTGEELREVCDAMIELGASKALIDGSIDRRAASAPAVAGGLVLATGAVLGESVAEVVAATVDAVEVIGLPEMDPVGEEPVTIARQTALGGEPQRLAAMLEEHARASTFAVDGALSERLLQGLVVARRARLKRDGRDGRDARDERNARDERDRRVERELRIVARDPTRVFLSEHGPSWYERQGIRIEVRETIDLRAITVNPVAPRSHRLDSHELREAIVQAIPDVPVIDVLDPDYY